MWWQPVPLDSHAKRFQQAALVRGNGSIKVTDWWCDEVNDSRIVVQMLLRQPWAYVLICRAALYHLSRACFLQFVLFQAKSGLQSIIFQNYYKQLAAHGKQNARSCGLRRSVAMTIIKLLPLKRALHNHWLSKIVWERWNKVSVGCLNFWCWQSVISHPRWI